VGIVLVFHVRFFVLAPEVLVLRMTQGENRPFCRKISGGERCCPVDQGSSRA
jgi:hypothetical protein